MLNEREQKRLKMRQSVCIGPDRKLTIAGNAAMISIFLERNLSRTAEQTLILDTEQNIYTSVKNYHSTPRNTPEDRRFHVLSHFDPLRIFLLLMFVYLNGNIKLMYLKRSRGSSVSIVTRLRTGQRWNYWIFDIATVFFVSSIAFSPSLLPAQPPSQWISSYHYPGLRRPEPLF